MNYLLRPLTIVIEYPDAYPPIARWASKTQHFGCSITARKVSSKFAGCMLVLKSANLHRPFAACIEGRRSFHYFYFYFRNSG